MDYLGTKDRLYIIDAFAGWDPLHRLKIRVVCSRAYHALFMTNITFGEPDFTIYNAGQFPANVMTKGVTSPTSVALSFEKKEFALNTESFTVMHYLMPLKGVLSLHASANEGFKKKDVSLFFGLSGTGKTTLSADPTVLSSATNEHCWSDEGVFNIEGGCYAKAIDLSYEKEPEIFSAIRFGSILENVILDENGVVDYHKYIPNAKIPCVGGHPENIILLTCDAFGVLPPVSKLTPEQSMYHFISGYTAKIAGTEEGVTEPQATFSACFGQPFLVWHPIKYAEMLAEKMKAHKANVWLINTGWTGGKYGVGSRINLKYSRAIIDAIHDGTLEKSIQKNPGTFPVFNLTIPQGGIEGVPDKILNPAKAWSSETEFKAEVKKLADLFISNFAKFQDGKGAKDLVKAGPTL
ncbi:ATP-utilizing phosphoenolpyruvate carboxykinase [Chytridium lagenaria]|nr:ATP-utilizing phosphoenolpyruvate carboxykinase [Chytridium lagenaria]